MDPNPKTYFLYSTVFLLCTICSLIFFAPPILILTAVSASLTVTTFLHGCLGGIKGAKLVLKSFKVGGSAAVFIFLAIFINSALEKQYPVIAPSPQSWIAIDKNGKVIPVNIGRKMYERNATEFLHDAVWRVESDSGAIKARKDEYDLASIDPASLERLGLFDRIEMTLGKGMQYTNNLTAGSEASLSPVYPLKIRATQFKDEYNGFEVLDMNDEIVFDQGLLRTRNFLSFEYAGKHYLIFVLGANHMDPDKAPWASFGLTQVAPTLRVPE